MEAVQQELTAEERHERLVAFLKRHMEEKRREEREMQERYQSDPSYKAKFAELRHINADKQS
ncbi:hypothetical protein [Fibrella forsythiae]|uniref:Uncharacterized protein n=1 Tax=Fibrella forsythiae TaxID=2817061 RepID=A0ABS3JPD3_9BACT|nr:hypothetical protein [Fibrella forsythiae]MBO0951852.1 hypothetical protein [Fibrella forsythiae]